MTVQLNWPPDVVASVTADARQKGLTFDDFVLQKVIGQEGQNNTELSDAAANRQAREAAGRSIRALRKGNILGPDLTIRDLILEGRRF